MIGSNILKTEGRESVARPWGRDAAQTWSENKFASTPATRDAPLGEIRPRNDVCLTLLRISTSSRKLSPM